MGGVRLSPDIYGILCCAKVDFVAHADVLGPRKSGNSGCACSNDYGCCAPFFISRTCTHGKIHWRWVRPIGGECIRHLTCANVPAAVCWPGCACNIIAERVSGYAGKVCPYVNCRSIVDVQLPVVVGGIQKFECGAPDILAVSASKSGWIGFEY